MHDRRDAGHEECMTGWDQGMRNTQQEGMQDMRNAQLEG